MYSLDSLNEIQKKAIPSILDERDTLILAPHTF